MDARKKKKIIAAITAVAAGSLSLATVVTSVNVYDSFFKRFERPDYNLVAGVYNYELVRQDLPREEFYFKSDGVNLKGYLYLQQNSKGLVVVCHGIHAGADDYLPAINYFYENSFSVFAFDYKGTYDSGGDGTVGMCESLVDLDHALNYVSTDARINGLPLFLFGHSWGGYAVTSVLAIHKEVKACAAVAAMNNGFTMILEKGEEYAGKFSSFPKPFLDAYQSALFRDYVKYNGVKGINSTDIPVLLAHGVNDRVIAFNRQSVISHKNEFTNPNVIYYEGVGYQGDHNNIWHSVAAAEYQAEVKAMLADLKKSKGRELTYEEKTEFYKTVNHELYSQVNEELFEKIITMYENSIN